MRAQGWHRDPFDLHEDRWFSEGRPTRLVRDQGAETYDEPPPGEPPAVPVSSGEGDLGQLARARLVSSGFTPAANRKPERNWRYWTVWPPCLLTVALTVLAIIFGSISLAAKPSYYGPAPSLKPGSNPGLGFIVGSVLIDLAGLIVAGVAAIVVLYAAADRQVSRRACALTGWVIAVLAYGWAVLIPLLSTIVR